MNDAIVVFTGEGTDGGECGPDGQCVCTACDPARTIGYWKNHPGAWPVSSITIGGVTYTKTQAIMILSDASSKNATKMLAAQLIAAKLNVLVCGAGGTTIQTTINQADAFLVAHPIGSSLTAAQRTQALNLKDQLDAYNNAGEG
jgi:hypothetical protein